MKWLTCEEKLEIITQLINGPSKRTEIEIYPATTGNRIIEIDTFDKSILSVDH